MLGYTKIGLRLIKAAICVCAGMAQAGFAACAPNILQPENPVTRNPLTLESFNPKLF